MESENHTTEKNVFSVDTTDESARRGHGTSEYNPDGETNTKHTQSEQLADKETTEDDAQRETDASAADCMTLHNIAKNPEDIPLAANTQNLPEDDASFVPEACTTDNTTLHLTEKADPLAATQTRLEETESLSSESYDEIGLSDVPAVHKEKQVIVIIGKTGNGKSSVGNILLGKRKFAVGHGMASTTTKTESDICELPDISYSLQVIDTPDISNLEMGENDKKTEIQKWKKMTSSSQFIILLTVRCDVRYTADEYATYMEVKELWGDYSAFCNHLVVGFTFGDRLDCSDITAELEGVCHELQRVWKDSGKRYVVFNNAATDEKKQEQRKKLIDQGEALLTRHSVAEEQTLWRFAQKRWRTIRDRLSGEALLTRHSVTEEQTLWRFAQKRWRTIRDRLSARWRSVAVGSSGGDAQQIDAQADKQAPVGAENDSTERFMAS